MDSSDIQGEKRGTHAGIMIMGVIALISCVVTDGGAGFYLTVGFFTAINTLSFFHELAK